METGIDEKMVSGGLSALVSQPAAIPTVIARNVGAHTTLIERPAAILVIAVWFGLLAGLGEVFLAAAGKFLLHHYTHLSPQIIWMTPSADVIIFAIPGLIFSLVIWRWPNMIAVRAALIVFAFLGFLGVLLRVTWLHKYASVLLALGLAVQACRFIVAHPERFYRFVRPTLGLMVAIVVTLAICLNGWQALGQKSSLAKLPPASAGAPNMLLIVLDTVGAEHLSLYGYSRTTTPQLERFAKTSVRFDRAISTAPWTLPSHASMFTGKYPHELSVGWQTPLDSSYPTLAEELSKRGYLTAGFVANTVYCSSESGLNRGFAHYEDFPVSARQLVVNSSLIGTIAEGETLAGLGYDDVFFGRKTAERINNDLLSWLSSKDSERPFFAFVNYFDAHAPYLPPKPFDSKFGSKRPLANSRIKASEKWTQSEVQAELDAYDNSLAYLDHQLGQLFDELQRRGLLDNTLVIVTSDHGEEFHEHGAMAHGWSTYLKALHVPLMISFPSRMPSGKIVSEPVTLRDLPATVIDLLSLNDKTQFPGTSLVRYWDNERDSASLAKYPLLSELGLQTTDAPEHYPIRKGNGTLDSLVVGQYHFIKSYDGREELYDFVADPLENNDLARSGEAQQMLGQLRDALEAMLARKPSVK